MSNFVVIFLCLLLGYLFRYLKLVKKGGHLAINTWVIYVGLPAVALKFIPQINWSINYIYTGLLPFLAFGVSFVALSVANKWLHFSKRTLYTLIIISGLSNTSFIGFPLVSSYYAEEFLKVAIVSDQITFFILSSIGVLVAASVKNAFTSNNEKYQYILIRIITFPPLIACLIALLFSDYLKSENFNQVVSSFAATVSPMALFSVGLQLNFKRISREILALSVGIIVKLLLIPITALLVIYFLGLNGTFFRVSVFEMAMPCLVASSIVVEKFGLNVKFANTLIGISIIVGLLMSYVWYSVINTLL
ncbi:AEC family transporter [Sphingobacterium bovistauri]|uniref:AEC family transporter n=1 Tax=Sphingobacterium bovistauri TaxID=2781959 RepID=A0ABS7Z3L6_9SPHI|nr:AEC family transporter [Sphingobacterium bovistauri]MCA5004593.1 AEC family transporter [Sphingobacterium bovistauri]